MLTLELQCAFGAPPSTVYDAEGSVSKTIVYPTKPYFFPFSLNPKTDFSELDTSAASLWKTFGFGSGGGGDIPESLFSPLHPSPIPIPRPPAGSVMDDAVSARSRRARDEELAHSKSGRHAALVSLFPSPTQNPPSFPPKPPLTVPSIAHYVAAITLHDKADATFALSLTPGQLTTFTSGTLTILRSHTASGCRHRVGVPARPQQAPRDSSTAFAALLEATAAKAATSALLRGALLRSYPAWLCASSRDAVWGCGRDGAGWNVVGKVLMVVRMGLVSGALLAAGGRPLVPVPPPQYGSLGASTSPPTTAATTPAPSSAPPRDSRTTSPPPQLRPLELEDVLVRPPVRSDFFFDTPFRSSAACDEWNKTLHRKGGHSGGGGGGGSTAGSTVGGGGGRGGGSVMGTSAAEEREGRSTKPLRRSRSSSHRPSHFAQSQATLSHRDGVSTHAAAAGGAAAAPPSYASVTSFSDARHHGSGRSVSVGEGFGMYTTPSSAATVVADAILSSGRGTVLRNAWEAWLRTPMSAIVPWGSADGARVVRVANAGGGDAEGEVGGAGDGARGTEGEHSESSPMAAPFVHWDRTMDTTAPSVSGAADSEGRKAKGVEGGRGPLELPHPISVPLGAGLQVAEELRKAVGEARLARESRARAREVHAGELA